MFNELIGTSKTRPSPSQQPRIPSSNTPSQTILGAKTRIVGNLKSEGNVHIEDLFEGDIHAGGHVSLGKQANLDGNLICERAVVAGLVRGDIVARTVSVLGTGRVLGNLRMEKLMTEDGAFIQGVITLEESLTPSAAQTDGQDESAQQATTAPTKAKAAANRRA